MDTVNVRTLASEIAAAKYTQAVLSVGGSVIAITYAAGLYGSWHVFGRFDSEDMLLRASENYRITEQLDAEAAARATSGP